MIMGQHAIHSLALGSIYALLAVGLTFMYGAQRSLAIAYGGLYAVGGYVAWWTVRSNRPLWVALGLAVLLCTLVGVLLHWGVRIARAHTAERSTLLGGLGGLICLGEVCRWVIGPYHMKVIAVDSHQIHYLGPLMVTDMRRPDLPGARSILCRRATGGERRYQCLSCRRQRPAESHEENRGAGTKPAALAAYMKGSILSSRVMPAKMNRYVIG